MTRAGRVLPNTRPRTKRDPGNGASIPQGARYHAASALLAQLVEHLHGKEGVDGSSPSEGSAKAPQSADCSFRENLHDPQRAVGMEPFMEPSGRETAAWALQTVCPHRGVSNQ